MKLLINSVFLTSSSVFLSSLVSEIKFRLDKGMLPALGDFVSKFSVELRNSFNFPFPTKRKKDSYIHGEYNSFPRSVQLGLYILLRRA